MMTNLNKIKIMHLNIRGIRSKYEELLSFLDDYKPEIISFNETCLNPTIKFNIPGYNLIRSDRKSGGKRTGGVMLAISDDIIFEELEITLKIV